MIAVERVEPDAGDAAVVVNVSADVELEKIRDGSDGGQPGGPHGTHGEGDDSEPSIAGKSVGVESGWKGALDEVGFDRPVEKKQILPALVHDGALPWIGVQRRFALLAGRAGNENSSRCGSRANWKAASGSMVFLARARNWKVVPMLSGWTSWRRARISRAASGESSVSGMAEKVRAASAVRQ